MGGGLLFSQGLDEGEDLLLKWIGEVLNLINNLGHDRTIHRNVGGDRCSYSSAILF